MIRSPVLLLPLAISLITIYLAAFSDVHIIKQGAYFIFLAVTWCSLGLWPLFVLNGVAEFIKPGITNSDSLPKDATA